VAAGIGLFELSFELAAILRASERTQWLWLSFRDRHRNWVGIRPQDVDPSRAFGFEFGCEEPIRSQRRITRSPASNTADLRQRVSNIQLL